MPAIRVTTAEFAEAWGRAIHALVQEDILEEHARVCLIYTKKNILILPIVILNNGSNIEIDNHNDTRSLVFTPC